MRREIPQKVDAQINFANWSHSPFALRFDAALFRRTRSASLLSITLTATALGVALSQQQAMARLALDSSPSAMRQTLPQADAAATLSSPIQQTVWRVQEVSNLQLPAAFSTTPNVLANFDSSGSSSFQSTTVEAELSRVVSTRDSIDSLAAVVVAPESTQASMVEGKVILNADNAPQNVSAVVHTVEKGENLTEIADKYRVSPDSIAQTNRIPNPNLIDINEDLVIPASTLSVATSSLIAATLTQDMSKKLLAGANFQANPTALAPKQDSSPMEYAPSAPQIARRSILQIPPLELPPLSSAEQFLPSMLQNGIQKFIWPANGVFTSGYGWRWGRMHRGIDIAAPVGTPVVASASGVVMSAGWNDGGYGNLVEIRHPDGSVTRYAHNQTLFTRPGAVVNQGEMIAHMGSTGRSTGPHTHFEIRQGGRGSVDPMFFLSRR